MKGDIIDYYFLFYVMKQYKFDIIFYLVVQLIVIVLYKNFIDIFKMNVLGIVYVLEVVKFVESVCVIINVISDKCYENDGSGD